MQPIVQVSNLSKSFGTFTAVNNLSFTIPQGVVYGFLGKNGAGKSTTLRMLLGLIKPNSGTINIFNQNLATHQSKILQNIGALIERPDSYNYLTAYQNINIALQLSYTPYTKTQINQVLDQVGLAHRAHSTVKTFSQGMKQRLGIATALVHNPELIILDEPTNGLDPQGISEIRELIINLSTQHNKTIIISSHLLHEMQQMCNSVIVMHHGNKITEGTLEQLINPQHTSIQITTTNPAQLIQAIQNQTHTTASVQSHTTTTVTLQAPQSQIPQIITHLATHQVQIQQVNTQNTLEAIFLNLTAQ